MSENKPVQGEEVKIELKPTISIEPPTDEKKEPEVSTKESKKQLPKSIFQLSYDVTYKTKKYQLSICEKSLNLSNKTTNKLVEEIQIENITAIHPLSSPDAEINVDDYGVLICYLKNKKKFIKYHLSLSEGDELFREIEEKKMSFILQQFVFFGKIVNLSKLEDISEFPLLEKWRRKILIIVNPKAGYRNGVNSFRKNVKPVLDKGHLNYLIMITEKKNHAKEIVENIDFEKYSEIGVVGGSGTINEVINGLMNHTDKSYDETIKTPISVFPVCGTSNSLAEECGCLDIKTAGLICCRGKFTTLDITSVFFGEERFFCFKNFCFGNMGISRRMLPKCMGAELGQNLGMLKCISNKNYYNFDFKIVRNIGEIRTSPFENKKEVEKEIYYRWMGGSKNLVSRKEKLVPDCPLIRKHLMQELKRISKHQWSLIKGLNPKKKISYKTKLSEFRNERTFLMYVQNLSKVSKKLWGSPYNEKNNGYLDLMLNSSDVFRKGLFDLFIKMKDDRDEFAKDPAIRGYRVKACYIKPLNDDIKYSLLDGEKVKSSPTLIEMHEGLGRIMCN